MVLKGPADGAGDRGREAIPPELRESLDRLTGIAPRVCDNYLADLGRASKRGSIPGGQPGFDVGKPDGAEVTNDLQRILEKAAELHVAMGDASAMLRAENTVTGQAQHAAEIVTGLRRAEESALKSENLQDNAPLEELYEATRSAERALLDFLRDHPGAPRALTLEVVSPAHGRLQVSGLARFFPARAVISRGNAVVVEGNDCALQSVDHYHVRQVTMPLEPLLEPGSRARAAVVELIKDPSDAGVRQFQRALRHMAEPPEGHSTRASLPVREDPVMVVTGSELVQRGDGSHLNVTTHWAIDYSEVQVIELLADNFALVQSFAAAATEPQPASATRTFLREALVAAGRVDDLALLDHSTGLNEANASVFALFGVDTISRAAAVLVGTDNQLDTDMQIHRGSLARRALLGDLARLRELSPQEAPGLQSPASVNDLRLPQRSRGAPLLPDCGRIPPPAGG